MSQAGNQFKIFLAGSIEMGKAENWQEKMQSELEKQPHVCVFNPRRDDWDSSWKQEITNPQFNQQVSWELNALESADLILFYFSPETQSPVTLLELGLFARSGKVVVCCPDGFWRKGNIDIVCQKYGVPQVFGIPDLITYVEAAVKKQAR